MSLNAGLQIDPAVRGEVLQLVADVGKLSGGAIKSSDLALEGDRLVARNTRGQIFLDELERSGGKSAGWDPQDGKIDAGSVIRIRQHASKSSLAVAMMDQQFIDLFRGVGPQTKLLEDLKAREEEEEQRKDGIKARAKQEMEALPDEKWAKSFFTKDEIEMATEARYRELWTRKDSRKLRALDAQGDILKQIIEKEKAGATTPEAREELRTLKVDYIEIAVAAALNDEGGNIQNAVSMVKGYLRKMGLLHRDNQFESGPALDVSNGPKSAQEDPVDSRMLTNRKPEEITPERLRAWPFTAKEPPRPANGEVLKLLGFRDGTSRGTHPQVVCQNADGEEVQVKFYSRETRGVSTPAINSRLMFAMGRETEGIDIMPRVRMEARCVLAAFETMNRTIPGIPYPDDQIPGVGGPTKKFGKGLHSMNEEVIASVKLKGQEEPLVGELALNKLIEAKGGLKAGDRRVLDSIEWVEVKNVDIEYNGKSSSIGPLSFDRIGHRDRRDIRTVGTTAESWLGIWDMKDDNARVDIVKNKDGTIDVIHGLTDVDGSSGDRLKALRRVRPTDPQLNTGIIRYDLKAPNRQTLDDATWDLGQKLAELSENQIRACVAGGTFDHRAGWDHFETLIAIRDDYARNFPGAGLQVLRPDGQKPYSPDWDRLNA